jgi:hypothetical protein
MAEQKGEQKAAPPRAPEPAPAVLGSAAASTDPAVQQLIAHRAVAVSNGDERAAAEVDAKLAGLGVE